MKTTLGLFLALAGSAFAQTNTCYYGASDDSGISADSSSAITSQDGWASGNVLGNNHFCGSAGLQSNRPDMLSQNQAVSLNSCFGIGLTSGESSSALLYLRKDYSFTAQTWNIVGLAARNAGWDTNTMTWNDIDGTGADDLPGGTLVGSLASSYGSLASSYGSYDTTAPSTPDHNITVDLTSAFQAYLNGLTPTVGDNLFQAYSKNNATATNPTGLLMTTIPELSSALHGSVGFLLLLRRRR